MSGVYLDGGFGVGKTHLLASTYYTLAAADAGPAAFATFGELTQLAGVFGFVECIDLLADYVVVCIDEFELDDPGNTTLISRLLSAAGRARGVDRGDVEHAARATGRGPVRRAGLPARDQHAGSDLHHGADRGPGLPAPRSAARAGAAVRRRGARRGPPRCRVRRSTTSTRCARIWRRCTRRGIRR